MKKWQEKDYEGNIDKWSFDKKLDTGKDFDKEWKAYEKSGVWKGYDYYSPPLLDITYIEQMANALASKYKIKVKSGKCWAIDVDKKELEYNPQDLVSGTKATLIALLLHEIGHLKHTTSPTKLKSKYLDKRGGFEVLNMFEDFRIDNLMTKSYEGAEDVYKALDPIIESVAEKYEENS